MPDFVARVNDLLPAQIRVLRCVPVTTSFNAKLQTQSRTYEYLAPSYAFKPLAGPAAPMPVRCDAVCCAETPLDGARPERREEILSPLRSERRRTPSASATRLWKRSTASWLRKFTRLCPRNAAPHPRRRYKGTKNYHNFTVKRPYSDASARRYIESFRCVEKLQHSGLVRRPSPHRAVLTQPPTGVLETIGAW